MGKTNGLRALDAAHLLIRLIRDVVENLPPQASGGLRRQITDSANSVASLIAEGFGRGTTPERVNRLRLSRGELEETQSDLKVILQASYISDRKFFRIWSLTLVLDRMIVKLMRRP
jgi:four helix bundle protein